jgi:tryptophan synthase beta chain
MVETKILLTEKEIPTHWYNIQADMPNPLQPPISPKTGLPVTSDELGQIFAKELLKQEMSTERWIEIPEEVRDLYRLCLNISYMIYCFYSKGGD